ncbi:metal-sensitive transcriptional regulator [Kitasatospora sp. NPDC058201]|uniref:metal-sensitive transcriptional regulator n=1 Tax=unclassified Kitasatospora TaxID=2633591 RepID=UPI0036579843
MTTTQARTEPEPAPAAGAEAHGEQTAPDATTSAAVTAVATEPAGAAATADAVGHHGAHGGPHGYTARKDAHLKRLRRIEGQIRGLQRMVDEDVYCIDVLTQVSASTKALQSFALSLLEEHLRHCVAAAAEEGGTELDAKVAEATAAIARLLRS